MLNCRSFFAKFVLIALVASNFQMQAAFSFTYLYDSAIKNFGSVKSFFIRNKNSTVKVAAKDALMIGVKGCIANVKNKLKKKATKIAVGTAASILLVGILIFAGKKFITKKPVAHPNPNGDGSNGGGSNGGVPSGDGPKNNIPPVDKPQNGLKNNKNGGFGSAVDVGEPDSLQKKNSDGLIECAVCGSDCEKKDVYFMSCCKQDDKKPFCFTCLRRVIGVAIEEKNPKLLQCPNSQCQNPICDYDLEKIVNNNKDTLRKIREITDRQRLIDKGCKHCPGMDCDAIVNNINNEAFRYYCVECNKEYCAKCLKDHCEEITCEEFEKITGGEDGEAQLKKWALEHGAKQCPNCKMLVQKNNGCLEIKCGKNGDDAAPVNNAGCGCHFCWNCLQKDVRFGEGEDHSGFFKPCPYNERHSVEEPLVRRLENNNRPQRPLAEEPAEHDPNVTGNHHNANNNFSDYESDEEIPNEPLFQSANNHNNNQPERRDFPRMQYYLDGDNIMFEGRVVDDQTSENANQIREGLKAWDSLFH